MDGVCAWEDPVLEVTTFDSTAGTLICAATCRVQLKYRHNLLVGGLPVFDQTMIVVDVCF